MDISPHWCTLAAAVTGDDTAALDALTEAARDAAAASASANLGTALHKFTERHDRCELYWLDITAGWDAAQTAATVRAWRNRRDLTSPYGPAGAQ